MSGFMSNAGGGGSAIQEAMARRGIGATSMDQRGPSAPGATPPMPSMGGGAPLGAAPAPSPLPPQMGMPPAPAAPPVGLPMGAPPAPQGSPEASIIISALKERLNHLSKVENAQNGIG